MNPDRLSVDDKQKLCDRLELIRNTTRLKAEEALLNCDFETLSFGRLRKRIMLEQENKCKCCDNSKWLDQPIALEINHIDGDNSNNDRSNLEALCPNCHSLTPTWRGRNVKSKKTNVKVSDELLLYKLIEFRWNMRQALLALNLSPKGSNYNRCHRLKREFGDHSH